MLVYLAEPIDAATHPGNHQDQITRILAEAGHTTYRPATAWRGYPAPANTRTINQTNNRVLLAADLAVADLSTNTPTIGTPIEVATATAHGIPAIALRRPDQLSAILDDMPLVTTFEAPGYWTVDRAIQLTELCEKLVADRPVRHPDLLRMKLVDGYDIADTRAYPDDAGIDLICTAEVTLAVGDYADIPTHIDGIQLPADTWGLVTGRSSALRKHGLHIVNGIIDPGWRGPLFVGALNLLGNPDRDKGSSLSVTVHVGDRIGQFIPIRNRTGDLHIQAVDTLDPHPRGLRGFGSSGQ